MPTDTRFTQMEGTVLEDGSLRLYDMVPDAEGECPLLGDVQQNADGFYVFAPADGATLRPKQLASLARYIGELNDNLLAD